MAKRDTGTKINVLMNIDSYFGEHQGRLAPVILFLGVSAIPLLLYALFLMPFLSFKYVLMFEVPFVIRMALLILGKENEKLEIFKRSKKDEYATADSLIRIETLH